MTTICWHDTSHQHDRNHRAVCPGQEGELIYWGRCRAGRRWFWTVFTVDTGERRDGWAATEEQACSDAKAAVVAVAGDHPAVVYTRHSQAAARLKWINAEKRRKRPASADTQTGPVEYLYGVERGGEDTPRRVVPFQITKKTTKRVYYLRRVVDGEPVIGFVDRETIERTGEVRNRGADGWWAADSHLYTQPPDIGPGDHPRTLVDVAYLRAEKRRLRSEAAAIHPDRGGNPERFREAYASYQRVAARLDAASKSSPAPTTVAGR